MSDPFAGCRESAKQDIGRYNGFGSVRVGLGLEIQVLAIAEMRFCVAFDYHNSSLIGL